MKKKILYITQSLPYPPSSGAHIKTLNTLTTLGSRYTIFLFCLTPKHPLAEDTSRLKKIVRKVSFFVVPQIHFWPVKHPWWFLKNYALGRPYLFFQYYHPEVNLQMKKIIDSFRPDIIHCDHFRMSQFLPREKEQFWVLESHNIESDISRQRAQYSEKITQRLLYFYETFLREKQEMRFLPQFDKIFVLSSNEQKKIKNMLPNLQVSVQKMSSNKLLSYIKGRKKLPRKNNYLLFVGDFDWFPNKDGMEWFIKKVFPLLTRRKPSLELHVVGNRSDMLLECIEGNQKVFLHGYQENMNEFFLKATVFIVPMRITSGIRFKILTAFKNEVPVITTTKGLLGLDNTKNSCVIADNPTGYAQGVLKLLESKNLRKKFVRNALQYLEKEFSTKVERNFLKEYENIVAERYDSHRYKK